ncbi:MAG: metallophosphoesterase [Flavobacteriaceae bacterium]|jgi:hypothetical protein|nr:metallophosphoesterase [Flavobacteriaceae bacterium]
MKKNISIIIFISVFIISALYFAFAKISPGVQKFEDAPHIFLTNDSIVNIMKINQDQNSKDLNNPKIISKFHKIKNMELSDYLFKKKLNMDLTENNYQYEFNNVEKMVAIGDVHGEYNALLTLLKKHKIISDDLDWNFDNGHVVFCGDVFDRGDKVTETLLFIYKLEKQAEEAGGRVHFVLGNHELMVLSGNLKYLSKKYKYIQNQTGINYSYLYNNNTLIGKWVRTKNAIIKINDILFVHGGIHPDLADKPYTIDDINNYIRGYLNYTDLSQHSIDLIGINGPLWYRGYINDDENKTKIRTADIERILKKYSAKKIIFAHTVVNEIITLYDNQLIAIDVPLSDLKGEALIIQNNKYSVLTINGERKELQISR